MEQSVARHGNRNRYGTLLQFFLLLLFLLLLLLLLLLLFKLSGQGVFGQMAVPCERFSWGRLFFWFAFTMHQACLRVGHKRFTWFSKCPSLVYNWGVGFCWFYVTMPQPPLRLWHKRSTFVFENCPRLVDVLLTF